MTRTWTIALLAGWVGLAGMTGCMAPAGAGMGGPALGQIRPGAGTKTGIGPYCGKATFTNAAGSLWWSVPTGKTGCTITDLTHTTLGYACTVEAVESLTLRNWFGANAVTFPVVAGRKYQFTTYVLNQIPPPNPGEVLKLDVSWTP